jgi:hypothetical protein
LLIKAHDDRGHEDRQDLDISEAQRVREQDVEGRRHRQEVGDAEEDLGERRARGRERVLATAEPERAVEERAPDDVGRHGQERRRRPEPPQFRRQPRRGGQPVRLQEEHGAGQRRDAQREGGGEDDLDLGDVEDRDAAAGVELVAERGADDEGEAGRVRDGLGAERGDRQLAQRHPPTDQPQRRPLVADQRREAERGGQDREDDLPPAGERQLRPQLVRLEAGEGTVQDPDRHREHGGAEDVGQDLPQPRPGRRGGSGGALPGAATATGRAGPSPVARKDCTPDRSASLLPGPPIRPAFCPIARHLAAWTLPGNGRAAARP